MKSLYKILIIAALVFTVIFLIRLAINSAQHQKDNDVDLTQLTMPVVGAKVQRQFIAERMDLVGTLRAQDSVEIKSPIDGLIEKVNFSSGQKVKKGDVLVMFNQDKLQSSLAQARANLTLAQSTLKRYQGLLKSGGISQLELDQAKNQELIAESAMQMARSSLNSCMVRAPFDGVIGERLISVGQFIAQGGSLAALVNGVAMKADFQVPERYLSQVEIGEAIDVKVEAYTQDHFEGKIVFIAPTIDEATRTILITADIANHDQKLRQGMFTNISLVFNQTLQALVVPENAVVLKRDQAVVYVVQPDDTIEVQPVECGLRMDGKVEILKGLKEGQMVVVEGYQKIQSGSKVTVRLQDQ